MKADTLSVNTNPFPGLRPFHESEQHLFFGRESQIDAMVDKLAYNRFLAVVGTSGSGKSSLVNCGLRPALRAGLMAAAGSSWRMAQCRPGSDPLGELSRALAEDGVLFKNFQEQGMPLHEIVDTTLRMSKLGLVDIVEQAHLPEGSNLLLVVDQFEELFRYRHLGANGEDIGADISQHAIAFVNLLLAAIEQTARPIYIVITMRSDFLGDCAQYPGLPEVMNDGQYLVPRMTREQRRAAIAGPIGVGGGKIHPALLSRLVNDVGENPDQLSILQHALNRTWAFWENDRGREGMLDIECYESIGSMSDALDLHADSAFEELGTDRQREICGLLFKALTDKASDPRGVRRPTRFSNLCDLCEAKPSELLSVIDVFRKPSRSFLMPPDGVVVQPDTVIDISHESLMRVWKRLDRWAAEEAESAAMYRRLSETAVLNTTAEAGLLRNPDLRVALKWRERNKPNASWARSYDSHFDLAMGFLARSEKSHRRRMILQQGAIALAACLLLGGVAFASYYINERIADEKLRIAEEEADNERQAVLDEKLLAENELAEVEEKLVDVAKSKAVVAQARDEALNKVAETVQTVEQIQEGIKRILPAESVNTGALRDSTTSSSTLSDDGNPLEELSFVQDASEVLEESVLELQALDTELDSSALVAAPEVRPDLQSQSHYGSQPVQGEPSASVPAITDNPQELKYDEPSDDEVSDAGTNEAEGHNDADAERTFTTQFQVCESVQKLIPSGCKVENESISAGKVYIFTRVVTSLDTETVMLEGFEARAERPFFSNDFTVKPNPDGYRLYTWKSLQSGEYRVCLRDQSGRQINCIDVTVN